ncbi:MAG: hypothetical protein II666_14035 [Butyrivibrio sp.]|nr:hypothetical protein [Butyrivibrio sp.]
MVNLRKITEENFIDAFNLKLGKSQERFVSHPIRSLALYRNIGFKETGAEDEDEIELSMMV